MNAQILRDVGFMKGFLHVSEILKKKSHQKHMLCTRSARHWVVNQVDNSTRDFCPSPAGPAPSSQPCRVIFAPLGVACRVEKSTRHTHLGSKGRAGPVLNGKLFVVAINELHPRAKITRVILRNMFLAPMCENNLGIFA